MKQTPPPVDERIHQRNRALRIETAVACASTLAASGITILAVLFIANLDPTTPITAGLAVVILLMIYSDMSERRRFAGQIRSDASLTSDIARRVMVISKRAGITVPLAAVFHDDRPSATCLCPLVGPPRLAISTGMITRCDDAMLAGVIAHEIAHLRHRDISIRKLLFIIPAAAVCMIALCIQGLFTLLTNDISLEVTITTVLTGSLSCGLLYLNEFLTPRIDSRQELNADLYAMRIVGGDAYRRLMPLIFQGPDAEAPQIVTLRRAAIETFAAPPPQTI